MKTDCSLHNTSLIYENSKLKPGRTSFVQKLFLTFRTIFVHMFCPCSGKGRASDKDLPVILANSLKLQHAIKIYRKKVKDKKIAVPHLAARGCALCIVAFSILA